MTIPASHQEHPIINDARRSHEFFIEHATGGSPLAKDSQKTLKKYCELAREVLWVMEHNGSTLNVGVSASGRLAAKLSDNRRISTPVVAASRPRKRKHYPRRRRSFS